jgi:hypothetical protein
MLESGPGTGEHHARTRPPANQGGNLGRLIGEHRNPRFRIHQKQETRRERTDRGGFLMLLDGGNGLDQVRGALAVMNASTSSGV